MEDEASQAIQRLRQRGEEISAAAAEEERSWVGTLRESTRLSGWFVGDGLRLVNNASARRAWEDDHNPEPMVMLLNAGKADILTQRLATQLIVDATTKRLPKRREDKKNRNEIIAECVLSLWVDGMGKGDAQLEVANSFGISAETVRNIMDEPGAVEAAKFRLLEQINMR